MKTIILIQCSNRKLSNRAKAVDLYIGDLFKKSYAYAKKNFPTAEIYILSAKHGLLELDTQVEPYNLALSDLSADDQKEWAQQVLIKLAAKCDLLENEFIILAGDLYRKNLIRSIRKSKIPLKHLRIGEQLHYLDKQ